MKQLTKEEKELINNYRNTLSHQQRSIREGAAALSRVAQAIRAERGSG